MAEQSNAPAKTSRKQQAEQTKQKLLTVAMELIREQGFDNVKIEDICRAAGVSTGAFYHHLKSKAGIVVESYSQCDAYFNETVYPSLAKDCTENAVLQYIAFQMQYATDFGVDIILQIYKAQLTEGTDFFLSPERGLPLGLTRILAHLQQQGVIRSEKPHFHGPHGPRWLCGQLRRIQPAPAGLLCGARQERCRPDHHRHLQCGHHHRGLPHRGAALPHHLPGGLHPQHPQHERPHPCLWL
ncbi:hypothetical protein B5G38_02140 [Gemmiger sp. An87]|nr:hypothetical protein B5G38_02140 [Gemmiger sp. An87]